MIFIPPFRKGIALPRPGLEPKATIGKRPTVGKGKRLGKRANKGKGRIKGNCWVCEQQGHRSGNWQSAACGTEIASEGEREFDAKTTEGNH